MASPRICSRRAPRDRSPRCIVTGNIANGTRGRSGRSPWTATALQAVALGLQDEKELLDAASRMERRLRQRKVVLDGFLVQEFVEGGKEVILGMTRDRVYGPLLVFGLGGIYVEYLKDVSFGLP